MSMDYLEAKETMGFLLACGIDARFDDDREERISIYDDGDYLFAIGTEEEWESIKVIAVKIATGLKQADEQRHEEGARQARRELDIQQTFPSQFSSLETYEEWKEQND